MSKINLSSSNRKAKSQRGTAGRRGPTPSAPQGRTAPSRPAANHPAGGVTASGPRYKHGFTARGILHNRSRTPEPHIPTINEEGQQVLRAIPPQMVVFRNDTERFANGVANKVPKNLGIVRNAITDLGGIVSSVPEGMYGLSATAVSVAARVRDAALATYYKQKGNNQESERYQRKAQEEDRQLNATARELGKALLATGNNALPKAWEAYQKERAGHPKEAAAALQGALKGIVDDIIKHPISTFLKAKELRELAQLGGGAALANLAKGENSNYKKLMQAGRRTEAAASRGKIARYNDLLKRMINEGEKAPAAATAAKGTPKHETTLPDKNSARENTIRAARQRKIDRVAATNPALAAKIRTSFEENNRNLARARARFATEKSAKRKARVQQREGQNGRKLVHGPDNREGFKAGTKFIKSQFRERADHKAEEQKKEREKQAQDKKQAPRFHAPARPSRPGIIRPAKPTVPKPKPTAGRVSSPIKPSVPRTVAPNKPVAPKGATAAKKAPAPRATASIKPTAPRATASVKKAPAPRTVAPAKKAPATRTAPKPAAKATPAAKKPAPRPAQTTTRRK